MCFHAGEHNLWPFDSAGKELVLVYSLKILRSSVFYLNTWVVTNIIVIFIIIFISGKPCLSAEYRKIVLFPLENISGKSEVPEDIVIRIAEDLYKCHGFEIISPSDLKDFLLKNRVRRLGSITEAQAKGLKRAFGADAVIITWVDLYEKGDNPKIGIGIRLIETESATVIWSDYVSLTGEDFRSWFGLGKITSIDPLTSKALNGLIDHFPVSFKKTPTEKTLFALERFSLIPSVVQGETPVRVSLHLVSLTKAPEKLFLLMGGKEWPLEKRQREWWEGEIKAPKRKGNYFARLKLLAKAGEIFFLNTASYLKVDNTPPKARLSCENTIFSPNRDGSKDALIIFPRLLDPEDIKLWGFYVFNEKGELVKRFEGGGDLPLALAWHGENDTFGNAEEGVYYLECRCQDKAGNIAATPRKKIVLDKTLPKLNVVIDIDVEKNKALFAIKYEELIGINQWKLIILDEKEDIYYDLKREGAIPSQVEVPLPDKKELYFLIEVLDNAGNKTESKGSLVSQRIVTGEKPEEEEKPPCVWDYEF